MSRVRVPALAWVLSGGTAIGLVSATAVLLLAHGTSSFYREGDAIHYLLIARDLFGTGRGFTDPSEAAYRYGRFGFPFLAWLVGFGRPAAVDWTLIGVNVAALAAIPGLAATLVVEYGAPPIAGAVALVSGGLYALYRDPVADPLMIALILLAFLLEARGHRRGFLFTIAYAVLVKEVAALALVPWIWRALRRTAWREIGMLAGALGPYATWCLWVRVRLGQLPFLAHTIQRTAAFGLPGAGIHTTWLARPPHYVPDVGWTVATFAGAAVGAYAARRFPLGGLAAVFAVLTVCLGPNALRYSFEIGRLLAPAQVFALLALAVAWSASRPRRARSIEGATADSSYLVT